jgi:hypothetical protein
MNKKIIYKFAVKKQEEVEEESTTNKKNKETGEMEKVTTTKKVKKDIPYDVIIYQPSRRQVEDADMEFSIEMSRCIKKGVLTKAMLAKKYSDSGGLLTEDDSNSLMRLYRELAETQESLGRLLSKKEKNKNEQKRADDLTDKFTETRKQIVDLETTYQTVFNHTADTKAQNKTILWYMLNLSYVQAEGQDPEPLFVGSTNEEKEDSYYEKDENGDELFDLSKEKLMTFISYWYFSQNPSEEDFQKLEEELDTGSL